MQDEASCRHPVVVVGAGQAGLSMSWHLRRVGLAHLVLERDRPGSAWRRERWDSFHLVTPNWQCRLPGFSYRGDDPDGFMNREQVASYLEGFARSFSPPLRSNVAVSRLRPHDGGFLLETSQGPLQASQVVVATGGYHDPVLPAQAASLPARVRQLTAASYRRPSALPSGGVLVVGSGLSGTQIAEELLRAGRRVHLSVGRAERISRRYRGRDVIAWQHLMGRLDLPVGQHPLGPAVRLRAEPYVSGEGGGHDIDLRRLADQGLRLHGRLQRIDGARLGFAPDLARNLRQAERADAALLREIDAFILSEGLQAPPPATEHPLTATHVEHPEPVSTDALDLEAEGVGSIVWCMGFRPNWLWIEADVFDEHGRPRHERGVTDAPGLYFLGLPWLHRWGSGRLSDVGRDAAFLAGRILAGTPPARTARGSPRTATVTDR